VQGLQPHPKSFELVKIREKSPKIRAKCEEIWEKYVQTSAHQIAPIHTSEVVFIFPTKAKNWPKWQNNLRLFCLSFCR